MLENHNPFIKHTFNDDHDHMVYYDYKKRIAYSLPKDKQGKYTTFSNRAAIAIILIILAFNFNVPLLYAILVGAVVYAGLTYMFFYRFLPTLGMKLNVDVADLQQIKNEKEDKETTNRRIIKIFLYIAFAILIVLNAIQQDYQHTNPWVFYLSIVVGIGALIQTGRYIYIVIKNKQ